MLKLPFLVAFPLKSVGKAIESLILQITIHFENYKARYSTVLEYMVLLTIIEFISTLIQLSWIIRLVPMNLVFDVADFKYYLLRWALE